MDSLKTAVVVNPASSNGKTAKRWPAIAEMLESEGLQFDHYMTAGPGDATELTRQALREGYNLVISVGGDGTANEVVNGFFTAEGPVSEKAAAGFISMGTGSDLIKTLGIPRDPAEAIKHILKSPVRTVDVGRVTFEDHDGNRQTRFFINIAGLGLDGDTVARVNRTSKALGGFISFLWGTVVSLLLYRNRNMSISVDGEQVFDGPVTVVVIGNGCFFGGGMKITPNAEMDDGLLDVVILHNLSKFALLANMPKVYRGAHLDHPRIISLRGRRVSVISPEEALLDLDGEQPGRAPAEIELWPRALPVKG